ncbi:MAG: hypothetical protein HPY54_11975 [Chthonomonadetes bacterium]|nr:hypothetical protein [Chthonomonadetes bacterium]
MQIAIRQTSLSLLPMQTRMPFRYGIATVRELQHLILRLTLLVDGREAEGLSADHLAPRWFIKDPTLSYEQETELLLNAIRHACAIAEQTDPAPSPFDLWWRIYHAQREWAQAEGIAPLVASFSVSLIERALLHAFCRAAGTRFGDALRQNTLGIDLGRIHPALQAHEPREYLPTQPLHQITVRHTVGLSDPLTEGEISPDERLNDGLPQSLEECIRAYGLTHFKVKLGGDARSDHARLKSLAQVLSKHCPAFHFTLDANEMYPDIDTFRAFWEEVQADSDLQPFLQALLFVEQPLRREQALSERTREGLHRWRDHPPIIIDESDAELHSLPLALECGYDGCSVKSCKGVFKGIANFCLAERLRRMGRRVLISGEDLSTVPPVSLLQDLAVMANLGVEHIERNGYHYFRGLTMLDSQTQERLLNAHPDLFLRHPQGFVAVKIEAGRLSVRSVMEASLGTDVEV